MELFIRGYFDTLLREAAASFAERCVHRAGGIQPAIAALAHEPQALGLTQFTDAFFTENLLDDITGSCFVLQSLERRTAPADPGGDIPEVLSRLARSAFADVLVVATSQVLQQQQIYS